MLVFRIAIGLFWLTAPLDNRALDLLTSILTSGAVSSSPLPALLPPTQHLALIATLSIHPNLTTRAKSVDSIQAGNLALCYLRLILKHVGPIQSKLAEAFTFESPESGHRRLRRRIKDSSPKNGVFDVIENVLSGTGSLWAHAEDFWQVVGWAFNCSVLHRRRWERWSSWLAYMIEVLETDWKLRETAEPGESLIVRYITSGGTVSGNHKKILRAMFADGQAKSSGEFREVWPDETKGLKKNDDAEKGEKLQIDIEADDYGDYISDENQADLENSSQASSSSKDYDLSKGTLPDVASHLGGTESIDLRLRLLSLLSKVSHSQCISHTFADLSTLYDGFVEHIRPLPLPTFFHIISPITLRALQPIQASILTQLILVSLIASNAPDPPRDGSLDQDTLEECYIGYASKTNSMTDNAKVSLCVETLMRLLDTHQGLEWTPQLQDAMEQGIEARQAFARPKRGSKREAGGDGAVDGMLWLSDSAERMRMVMMLARPVDEDGVPLA